MQARVQKNGFTGRGCRPIQKAERIQYISELQPKKD